VRSWKINKYIHNTHATPLNVKFYIQGVSGGIVNTLGGSSMDYSE